MHDRIDVVEEDASALRDYARISIAFEVREVLDVTASPEETHRFSLTPRPVARPWVKDYDAIDGGPAAWPAHFDVSLWTFFAARVSGERVGAATVVFRAPDVEMLAGRADVALLWDIRVATARRGQGVGSALLAAVEGWAAAREAAWLEVETQTINAPACRFYERHGFVLRAVNPFAYPTLPTETQLLWHKRLGA